MFVDARDMLYANPSRATGGLAVVDVEGDGRLALMVAGFREPNRLLCWQAGSLRDIADAPLADRLAPTTAVAAADADRDGIEEIYTVNCDVAGGSKTTADRLFHLGRSGWRDAFERPGNEPWRNRLAARSVAALDRRGAGRYGFLLATHGSPIRLYEIDESGQIEDRAAAAGLDEVVGGSGLVVAPLVSQRPDVFAANLVGPSLLFRPRGDGTYDEAAREHGLGNLGATPVAAALDANGDGYLDLICASADGRHALKVRDALGRYGEAAPPILADASAVSAVVVADFDNDGYEEILIRHQDEPTRLFGWREGGWRPLGSGAALEPLGGGGAAVAADLDGDGRLELVAAGGQGEAAPLRVLRCEEGTRNGWLRVRARTATGAPARGALVTLEAGGRRQIRVVDGGCGNLSRGEPVAHFGLGGAASVDLVTVRWPDGTEMEVRRPQPDRILEVRHPAFAPKQPARR